MNIVGQWWCILLAEMVRNLSCSVHFQPGCHEKLLKIGSIAVISFRPMFTPGKTMLFSWCFPTASCFISREVMENHQIIELSGSKDMGHFRCCAGCTCGTCSLAPWNWVQTWPWRNRPYSRRKAMEYPLGSSKMARENGPFKGDFPIKTSIYRGFSIAMFDYRRVLDAHPGKFYGNCRILK